MKAVSLVTGLVLILTNHLNNLLNGICPLLLGLLLPGLQPLLMKCLLNGLNNHLNGLPLPLNHLNGELLLPLGHLTLSGPHPLVLRGLLVVSNFYSRLCLNILIHYYFRYKHYDHPSFSGYAQWLWCFCSSIL